MPEYSSTTITPADGVKTPAMNGSTSGNYQLSALRDYILSSKGQANGLASLDANGKLPSSQLPDIADDVIVATSYATLPSPGISGKLYITADNNKMYRWEDALATPDYVELSVDLSAYATKAELNAEIAEREANDAKTEARLENLEQKAGDYSTVQYRGTNSVPTGKAKYAMVESIVGKSRAWNNIKDNGDFSVNSGWSGNGGTVAIDTTNHKATLTITDAASYDCFISTFPVAPISGHTYMVAFDVTSSRATACGLHFAGNSVYSSAFSPNSIGANVKTRTCAKFSFTNASPSTNFYIYVNSGGTYLQNGDTVTIENLIVRDLTLIFPEGVPSTVAECVQKCPDILKYDAFGYSIVDTVVEGVESVGVNLWNEQWENGRFNTSTGAKDNSDLTRIRNTTPIPVKPNTSYYMKSTDNINLLFYDIMGNFVQYQANVPANGSFTTPANGFYMNFFTRTEYPSSYQHDIQFCLNSVSDKTTYHPYMTDTLSLPTPVTLRSAGSVADTDELNVEVNGVAKRRQTKRVYHVDMGTLIWTTDSLPRTGTSLDGTIKAVDNSQVANIVCGKYEVVARNYIDAYDKAICVNSGAYLIIRDTSFTGMTSEQISQALSGVYADIELKTYAETLSDPIINNFLATEGGGTINTIQNQTPVIDNCLDVAYLAL